MPPKSIAAQVAPQASPLILVGPPAIFEQLNRIYEEIASRAFEIFESDGRPMGHDLEHWFRAEAELLFPIQVKIDQSGDGLTLRAEVPGFNASELEISLEPRKLTILGTREHQTSDRKNNREHFQDRLLRTIELPVAVNPDRAVATLRNGVLEVAIPKLASAQAKRIDVKAA